MAYEFKIHDYAFAYVIRQEAYAFLKEGSCDSDGYELLESVCDKFPYETSDNLLEKFPWFYSYIDTQIPFLLETLPILENVKRTYFLGRTIYYDKDKPMCNILSDYLILSNVKMIPQHVIDIVWASEKTCCVCSQTIPRQNFTVTRCGHSYCIDCLTKTYSLRCKTCNVMLK